MTSFLNALWAALADPEHHQGVWLLLSAIAGFLTAAAAWLSVLIVGAAAYVAWGQLREARTLRLAQSRPFVVIEFHPLTSQAIFLRIANIGSTMARDVHFSFDRPLTSSLKPDLMDLKILKTGIASFPPGRVIEFLVDMFHLRDEKDDRYVVTIDYRGDGQPKPFHDSVDLDLGIYRNTSPNRRAGLDELHQELKEIAKSLDHFKAWGEGILVMSPVDVAKRDEATRKAYEARASAAPPVAEPKKPARRRRPEHHPG